MQNHSKKVGFISLGCPKALVDSEQILTQLRADGYQVSPSYKDSDLVIVNTCGFIDDAVQESLDTIGEALNENGKVIVTGCLGAKGDIVKEQHPNVLAVTGPHAYEEVMNAVHEHLPAPEHNPFLDITPQTSIKLTPRHYSYLKISEGCNHSCTFCIIPSLRGGLVSRPIGSILDEAEALVDSGTKELLVVSQDTSAYGIDVKYKMDFWGGQPVKTRFAELAKMLGQLEAWVRLHYVYPYPHVDEIIPLMADGHILPYLDIPFQHASPRILKAMKRPAHIENNLQRIKKWREICPDITLRSTFIVGFPGETEDDFNQLLEFMDQAQLDRVGCFKYSDVESAQSNQLPDHVPEEVKAERLQRFMEHQEVISINKLEKKIGTRMVVLVDEVSEENIIGRTEGDAPEIDGIVVIDNIIDANPGDFIEVEITDSSDHDLFARPVTYDD